LPKASGLEAALVKRLDVEVELIGGDAGVFDVRADGDLVFSKHEAGRFPETEEVLTALKQKMD